MRFVRYAVGVAVGLGAGGGVWWLLGSVTLGVLVALVVTLFALYLAWEFLTLGPEAGDMHEPKSGGEAAFHAHTTTGFGR